MDTALDTVTVTEALDTAALAMGSVTVMATTVTVWDTTVTTVARGPLMPSQKLMLMPMLTTVTMVTPTVTVVTTATASKFKAATFTNLLCSDRIFVLSVESTEILSLPSQIFSVVTGFQCSQQSRK